MIYWLLEGKGLILRITGAAILSFAVVIVLGPRLIRFLLKQKLGDRPEFDHADLNELTRHKSNTPTMGGALIVVAIFVSVLLFADVHNMYIRMGLLAAVWLGILGGVDDWIKLRYSAGKGSRDGLHMWEKLLFQMGLALLLSLFMYHYGSRSFIIEKGRTINPAHGFYLPFLPDPIALSRVIYVIIAILVLTGSSNAVNLTDGMDGLASGCLVIVSGTFLLLSWVVGVRQWALFFHMPFVAGSAEMTIICASMLGACLGFLWYNAPPAQVFMGDTGSLPLGGLLGFIAVVMRQEVLLLVAGGIFVAEAVSVMLQVGYYKMTKGPGGIQGKRIFRCAPLHHHFHLGGWAESKVVVRFWLVTIILCALSLATLKLR
ncbi:MAG: phospho-N-acetylmuramoyl-pentapeptide-transferase [Phycisphaerae bacterium]